MNSESMYERKRKDNWIIVDYLSIVFSEKDNPNELYEKKLERIIKEQPELSPTNIRIILLDIFDYIDYRNNPRKRLSFSYDYKKTNEQLEDDKKIIDMYFNKIYEIYKEKMTGKELVNLCMMINNEDICEKIINDNYKTILEEVKKTIYIPSAELDELTSVWEIEDRFSNKYKELNYKVSVENIHSNIMKVFYKYFEKDIKILFNNNIEKYDYRVLASLDEDEVFYFLQKEIRNNNIDSINKIIEILNSRECKNVKLTNILQKSEWLNVFKNKELMKKLLVKRQKLSRYDKEKEELFQDKFWSFINDEINIESIRINNINKIDSIYSFGFLLAINSLSKESYTENKKSRLFLMCFKTFLKEFAKEYDDKLTSKDLEYLERIFRRGIQRNNVYKIFLINNKKNLIHNYKSDDLLKDTSNVSIEDIKNYNVKQYRKIKSIKNEKENCNASSLFSFIYTSSEDDDYIIRSLNLLDFDVTKKLINYNVHTWKNIVDILKDKPKELIDEFKMFVMKSNKKDGILEEYSLAAYISVFEKILADNQKPTIIKMNKIIKSIKNLLVPYNIEIEENLELLNYVAKGEPLFEKIKGIKLYEDYRKRIKSSIPDYHDKSNELDYGLVSLHDRRIISNGIGKYILPNNLKASSCLTPNGKAKTCLEHGAINPNGRFFKIEKNNKIVAYSWIWRAGDVLCFDNIELTEEIEKIPDIEKTIYEIYMKAAKGIVEKTKKEKNGGIKLVLIGRNPIDVKNSYIDNLQKLNEITDENYTPNSKEELYLKDSENKVILYVKNSDNLDTKDVEPIYLYEREKVNRFEELEENLLKIRMNSIYYDYCLQNSKKYHEIDNIYKSGYIGEDWFVGKKDDGTYDFYYNNNDKRLFQEAKEYIKIPEKENKKSFYIPKYKIDNILDEKKLKINEQEIEAYLESLNERDYVIPNNYYSHTTLLVETLNDIFKDGAITSSYYGKHDGGGGSNGEHYICIAKVGSSIHNFYKRTGTIILDDNMQIFNDNELIIPEILINDFRNTSYPIRETGKDGEYQVKNIITKDHFDSLLAMKDEPIALSQIVLLNELYDLNLPIVYDDTMSKIDSENIKKYIKLSN